jgi:hypothetical protein
VISRSCLALLIVFGLLCSASDTALAEDMLKGTIVKAEKDLLTLKTEKGEVREFKVPSDCQITVNKKKASFSDLKAGLAVLVSFNCNALHTIMATSP